jgi:hypothetical protein
VRAPDFGAALRVARRTSTVQIGHRIRRDRDRGEGAASRCARYSDI